MTDHSETSPPQHSAERAPGHPEAIQVQTTVRVLEAAIGQALKKVLEEQRVENARLAAKTAADFYRSPVSEPEERAFSALTPDEQVTLLNMILSRVYVLVSASTDKRNIFFINRDPVPYAMYLPPANSSEITSVASERAE